MFKLVDLWVFGFIKFKALWDIAFYKAAADELRNIIFNKKEGK